MNENTKSLIDTEDMGLAIALICMGYDLIELEKLSEGKRITFRFLDSHGINTDTQNYWHGKLRVDAKQFWNESKNLKTRLYSLK